MDWEERIEINPAVLVGKPVIRGTRLAVEFVLDLLANHCRKTRSFRTTPVSRGTTSRVPALRGRPSEIGAGLPDIRTIMRLLANENFPSLAVVALRAAGHDVVWARADMPAASDEAVLRRAQVESRVIVTFDKVSENWLTPGTSRKCGGVILFRLRMQSPEYIRDQVVAMLSQPKDWSGHFAVVDELRTRVRRLRGTDTGTSECADGRSEGWPVVSGEPASKAFEARSWLSLCCVCFCVAGALLWKPPNQKPRYTGGFRFAARHRYTSPGFPPVEKAKALLDARTLAPASLSVPRPQQFVRHGPARKFEGRADDARGIQAHFGQTARTVPRVGCSGRESPPTHARRRQSGVVGGFQPAEPKPPCKADSSTVRRKPSSDKARWTISSSSGLRNRALITPTSRPSFRNCAAARTHCGEQGRRNRGCCRRDPTPGLPRGPIPRGNRAGRAFRRWSSDSGSRWGTAAPARSPASRRNRASSPGPSPPCSGRPASRCCRRRRGGLDRPDRRRRPGRDRTPPAGFAGRLPGRSGRSCAAGTCCKCRRSA